MLGSSLGQQKEEEEKAREKKKDKKVKQTREESRWTGQLRKEAGKVLCAPLEATSVNLAISATNFARQGSIAYLSAVLLSCVSDHLCIYAFLYINTHLPVSPCDEVMILCDLVTIATD